MTETYDAIVIGAGVIGAAVGLELAKKGWRTLNVDKLPTAGYGSTAASCAIVRVHYSTFDGCALAYEGYHYWKDWAGHLGVADERGLARFVECGCMVYRTEQNGYLQTVLARADELAVPYELWGPDQVKARLPMTDTRRYGPVKLPDDPAFGMPTEEDVTGAAFFPTAGYVNDPQLSAHNLQRAAEAHGGAFRFNAAVAAILIENGRAAGVRLADGGEIRARVVVNVAGPHAAKINALAGVAGDMTIRTQALKVEVAHVPAPKGPEGDFVYEGQGMVVSDSDIGCYSRPETGNHLLIGSEDPPCDPQILVDPEDWDESFTDQWRAQVYRQAQRYPDLPVSAPVRGVVALYDKADDWIPIYDKSSLPGYYMACGTSGNQYKNAPVAGVLMAELIEACEGGHDHDADPVRFHLKHVGRTVSLGFYSRKREINPESSMSVLG